MGSPLFRLQGLAEAAVSEDGVQHLLNRLTASSDLAEAVLAYLQRPVELHPTLQRVREKLAARLYSPGAEQDVSALLELLTSSLASLEQRAIAPVCTAAEPDWVEPDWVTLRPATAWIRICEAIGNRYGSPDAIADAVEALAQKVDEDRQSWDKIRKAIDSIPPGAPTSTVANHVIVVADAWMHFVRTEDAKESEPQPSVPDEWGATDLHTEMKRVQANLDHYSTALGQGAFLSLTEQNQCAHDLRATLGALRRADSVIRAQAHDLGAWRDGNHVDALRADLAKEHENSAALRAEIDDVVAERNRLAEQIADDDRSIIEFMMSHGGQPGDTLRSWALRVLAERDSARARIDAPKPDQFWKNAISAARIAAFGAGWEADKTIETPYLSEALAAYLRTLPE